MSGCGNIVCKLVCKHLASGCRIMVAAGSAVQAFREIRDVPRDCSQRLDRGAGKIIDD
jgi:hypothetical protein